MNIPNWAEWKEASDLRDGVEGWSWRLLSTHFTRHRSRHISLDSFDSKTEFWASRKVALDTSLDTLHSKTEFWASRKVALENKVLSSAKGCTRKRSFELCEGCTRHHAQHLTLDMNLNVSPWHYTQRLALTFNLNTSLPILKQKYNSQKEAVLSSWFRRSVQAFSSGVHHLRYMQVVPLPLRITCAGLFTLLFEALLVG